MLLFLWQARAEDIDSQEEAENSYSWQQITAATVTWVQVYGTPG